MSNRENTDHRNSSLGWIIIGAIILYTTILLTVHYFKADIDDLDLAKLRREDYDTLTFSIYQAEVLFLQRFSAGVEKLMFGETHNLPPEQRVCSARFFFPLIHLILFVLYAPDFSGGGHTNHAVMLMASLQLTLFITSFL